MKTLTFHVQRFWPPVFLFTVSIALLCHGAPAPTWEAASSLFAKGRWADAEKALDAYAAQTPAPPHRAEAFVLEARCREKRRDVAGARKIYESVIRDDSLRRASPAAVADAYNRLHALLAADAKAA
ncbi:MAG: tetratricopeptide repeat protein, partial [Kiritimatiellae bacterium]|nr:tetratricopeptide repeat protein [Kiritimatiellia bacterium]